MSSFAVLILAWTTWGQVTEELQVVLREARVHVVDSNGEPVTGLGDEDFDLSTNGVSREITFFEEVDRRMEHQEEAEATAPDAEPGAMLLVLDTSMLSPRAVEPMLQAVRDILSDSNLEGTLFKVVQLERGMNHLTGFTTDRDALLDALSKVEAKGTVRRELDSMESQILNAIEGLDRAADNDFMSSMMNSSSGGGLGALSQSQENNEAAAQSLADQVVNLVFAKEKIKERQYFTYHFNMMLMVRALSAMNGPKSILYFNGGLFLETQGRYTDTAAMSRDLAEAMNAANITLYSFTHGDIRPIGASGRAMSRYSVGDENELLLTLERKSSYGAEVRRLFRNRSGNTVFENRTQLKSGPLAQAQLTGGFAKVTSATEKMDREFDGLVNQMLHFYRLGYTTDDPDAEEFVKVRLTAGHGDMKLVYGDRIRKARARQSEEFDAVEAEMTLLYQQSLRNDMDCSFHGCAIPVQDSKYAVPVNLLMTEQDRLQDNLLFGFAALDASGNPLDIQFSSMDKGDLIAPFFVHDLLITEVPPARIRVLVRSEDKKYTSLLETLPERDPGRLQICYARAAVLPLNVLRQSDASEGLPSRVQFDPTYFENRVFVPIFEKGFTLGHGWVAILSAPDTASALPSAELQFQLGDESFAVEVTETHERAAEGVTFRAFSCQSSDLKPGAGTVVARLGDASYESPLRFYSTQTVSQETLNQQLLAMAGAQEDMSERIRDAIRMGAELDARDEHGHNAVMYSVMGSNLHHLKLLLDQGCDLNAANERGVVALMLAIQEGFDEGVDLLIERGADLDVADYLDNGLWHYAATANDARVEPVLRERGLSPEPTNAFGHTPAFIAGARGNLDFLRGMEHPDLSLRDASGYSLMHRAVFSAVPSSFKGLVALGAPLDMEDGQGLTPLMLAAQNGLADAVKALAEAGADLQRKDDQGHTPLILAAMNGYAETVKLLLERGADTRAEVHDLDALMLASISGHVDVVKALVKFGMDPERRNKAGLSALDYARRTGKDEVIRLLGDEDSEFEWWDEQ